MFVQVLMEIVFQDEIMMVEVWLFNKDIGFVCSGQKVEIKIYMFLFIKYGVIDVEVINIFMDVIVDEKFGLIYKMKLKMDRSWLWVEDWEVNMILGMVVMAEVKIGYCRIVEYILVFLFRY